MSQSEYKALIQRLCITTDHVRYQYIIFTSMYNALPSETYK